MFPGTNSGGDVGPRTKVVLCDQPEKKKKIVW
jgi:hypothetical protein